MMAADIAKSIIKHPMWIGDSNSLRGRYGEYITVLKSINGKVEIITENIKIARTKTKPSQRFTQYRVEYRDTSDVLWMPKIRVYYTMEEAEAYGRELLT